MICKRHGGSAGLQELTCNYAKYQKQEMPEIANLASMTLHGR
jgi:hypothetical protein